MRPYLAIIKDSFRAAMASRVLYVLLGLIILFLLVLAPAHVRESLDTRIIPTRDIPNPIQIVIRLNKDREDPRRPGMQRIWEKLPASMKAVVEQVDRSENNPDAGEQPLSDLQLQSIGLAVGEALNDLISDESFFRAEDWQDRSFGVEAEDLMDRFDDLNDNRRKRLNRILISEAFGPTVKNGAPTSMNVFYAWYEFQGLSASTTQQQFASLVTGSLSIFLDKFVLSIGLIIAIVVSAGIIPETFEPGTLNLLLSKPISRAGLFLAKFAGGCAFITLCAALLFTGTWLWLGVCLGIWEPAILISIPLYVVVFAIYYSVSSYVGLTTRSPIMAVMVTAGFWAVCFAVGTTYHYFNTVGDASKIVAIQRSGDSIYQMDTLLDMKRWEPQSDSWNELAGLQLEQEEALFKGTMRFTGLIPPEMPKALGPVAGSNGEIVAGRFAPDPQGFTQSQGLMTSIDGVTFVEQGQFPREALRLFPSENGPVVVTSRGEFLRYGSSAKSAQAGNQKINPFVFVSPRQRKSIGAYELVDLNRMNSEIAIYYRSELYFFRYDSEREKYFLDRSIKIDTGAPAAMSCRIAYQGNTVLLVLGNGQIISVDSTTLEEKNGYLPETQIAADYVTGSPDGRWFAVGYQNKTLWLLDTENDSQMTLPGLSSQGTITTASFDDQNQLLVADQSNRIGSYQPATLECTKAWTPDSSYWDLAWRYGVNPIYRFFPKPGEFYRVVAHFSESNNVLKNKSVDLALTEPQKDPWSPLISGVGFMVFMLVCSCFRFWRKDF